MSKTTKTVRLPDALLAAAEARAADLGVTFTDVLADALAKELSMTRDPSIVLLTQLSAFITQTFDPRSFPPDATLITVRHVRDDVGLRGPYEQAIRDAGGAVDQNQKGSIHRRIGRLVKRLLGAKVIGRSAPLDPSVELIESHALLAPV